MAKPTSPRAFSRVGRLWKGFHHVVTACAAAVCISGTVPNSAYADPPMDTTSASPSESSSTASTSNTVPNSVPQTQEALPARSGNMGREGMASPAANRGGFIDRSLPRSRTYSRGESLARTALSYRGLPYRWGGTSARSGFDCSGLVQAVCAKWGIYLPRCAGQQIYHGIPVKPDKLQPGDLVFFKNTYKRGLSHVGIYVGDGWFLHAAGRRYGVILSRLNQPYNLHHWYGARRLNLSKLPPVPGEEKKPERVIIDDGTQQTSVIVGPPAPPNDGASPPAAP